MNVENLYYLGNKAIIRNTEHKILLLHVNPNYPSKSRWDLPGGRVNKGEDVITALKREIEEETGIQKVEVAKHLGMALTSFQIPIGQVEKAGLILSVYVCNVTDLTNLKPEEGVEFVWSSREEVLQRLANYPNDLLNLIEAELTPKN